MRSSRPSILYFFAFSGMELCYLYLLASLFAGPSYSLILSLLLYPMALLSNLAPAESTASHRLKYSLELVLVVLVILLVAGERLLSSRAAGQADIPSVVLWIGFCGLSWLLGHTVPHRQVNYPIVTMRLQVGLLIVLIFSQIVSSALPVFLFFLLAPLALFYGRWANAFSRGATVLNSPNPGHVLVAGAGVIVPGMALIFLFSPEVARSIVKWLGDVSDIFSDWMMSQHQAAADQSGKIDLGLSCNMRPAIEESSSSSFMTPAATDGVSGISPVVIWIIIAIIFLVIVFLIGFALSRRKTRGKTQSAEPVRLQIRKVSLNTLRGLISFFPRLLKKIWYWLSSILQKWKKRPASSEESILSVRDIYRTLLRWAAKKGISRDVSQTPLEHLELLVQNYPQQQDGFRQITEAYIIARYSRRPVSQQEFRRIKEIWNDTAAYLARLGNRS